MIILHRFLKSIHLILQVDIDYENKKTYFREN